MYTKGNAKILEDGLGISFGEDKFCSMLMHDTTTLQESRANAKELVKRWNSHEALVEALEYVVRYHRENDSGEGELYGLDFVTTCIQALKQAKKGE